MNDKKRSRKKSVAGDVQLPRGVSRGGWLRSSSLSGRPSSLAGRPSSLAGRHRLSQTSLPGALEPLEGELASGTHVDHYELMRLLGRGGMGEVYLARDTHLGRKVALKLIHRKLVHDPQLAEQLLFEARATARFNHPNIVTIYGVGEHDGRPYVALEFLRGQNLRERLIEQHLSVAEVLRIALPIAQALQEAHENGILHRDLKPENVVISRDGRVRVLDFGLAKFLPGEEAARRDSVMPEMEQRAREDESNRTLTGTPGYMAPEQWLSDPLGGRADVWALGAMMYEMLTGALPYDEESLTVQCARVCGPQPVPPIPDTFMVPEELNELVLSCLFKRQKERPTAEHVVRSLTSLLTPQRGAQVASGFERSPYRGLMAFRLEHAALFFGREAEIDALVERSRVSPVLPVVGPSGAGKSSLVQAGLVPRLLEQGDWLLMPIRPGKRPFRTLAASLLVQKNLSKSHPVAAEAEIDALKQQLIDAPRTLSLELSALAEREGGRLLLVVDQLEELFTHVEDEYIQQCFIKALFSAAEDAQDPVRVVFTLRDDFLWRVVTDSRSRDVLSQVTVVQRLDDSNLVTTLTRPLEMCDYAFEDDAMPQEMAAAVSDEPACLPMLQFAAHQLWEQRDQERRLLLRSSYEAMGGVEGALAKHADGVIEGLSERQRITAREMLLRLVTQAQTRRLVSRINIVQGLDDVASTVLSRLIDARLVALVRTAQEEAYLELAHESLIYGWQRLSRWIDESREDLAFVLEVTEAAELWDKRGRRVAELWQGEALVEAERKLARSTTAIPPVVERFLDRSQARRRAGRWRFRAAVAGVTLVLAGLATFLGYRNREAENLRRRAEERKVLADQRRAEGLGEGALAAYQQGDVLEARAKLRMALELEQPLFTRALWQKFSGDPVRWSLATGAELRAIELAPNGQWIAAGGKQRTVVLVAVDTRERRLLRGHRADVTAMAFSRDGSQLATGSLDGEIRLWPLPRGQVRSLRSEGGVHGLNFGPNGKVLVAASSDGNVRIWNLQRRSVTRSIRTQKKGPINMALASDGRIVATGGEENIVRLWDAGTGAKLREFRGHQKGVRALAFYPGNKLLATAGGEGAVKFWDVKGGEAKRTLAAASSPVEALRIAEDGSTLATANSDGAVVVWSEDGKVLRQLNDHRGPVRALALSKGQLFSGGVDGRLVSWQQRPFKSDKKPALTRQAITAVAFSRDGSQVLSGSEDGSVRLWDRKDGRILYTIRAHNSPVRALAFHPTLELFVSGGGHGQVRVWHRTTAEQRHSTKAHQGSVNGLAFGGEGLQMYSVGAGGGLRRWNAEGWNSALVSRSSEAIKAVALLPGGDEVLLLLESGALQWVGAATKLSKGWKQLRLERRTDVRAFAFGPSGNSMATAFADGSLRMDRVEGEQRSKSWRFGKVSTLAFGANGRSLAVADSGRDLVIVDSRSGQRIQAPRRGAAVEVLAFSASSEVIATGGQDGNLRLWDTQARPLWRAPLLVAGDAVNLKRGALLVSHRGLEALGDASKADLSGNAWSNEVLRDVRYGQVSQDGVLCLHGYDGSFRMIDVATAKRISALPKAQAVVALAKGCAWHGKEGTELVRHGGERVRLQVASPTKLLGSARDGALLVSGLRVFRFDDQGRQIASWHGGEAISSVAEIHGKPLAGYEDGSFKVLDKDAKGIPFELTPASAVRRLASGPANTVVVGYASGEIGLWSLHSGRKLLSARLQGSVEHLLVTDGVVYAASELGDHTIMDVRSLRRPACSLLRDVWAQVPVVWDRGYARRQGPPADHRCRPEKP
jgi:WD40 repeat protein/serine/threonine protein kinase